MTKKAELALGKPRLLMVDDSKVMRLAAKKMLGGRFDVVVAEDGMQGWEAIASDPTIQVVFTDLSMPELDGYGLLRKIRNSQDNGINGLPVIIVTGAENDEAAREKALQLGGTDFISKPFNSTDLQARANAHAAYQREKRALEQAATVDMLTGLGNKNHFMGRLKQDLAFSARHKTPLSVVRVDVDGFNKLFIRLGKEAGDRVLKEIAGLLSGLVRKEDTAARIGLAQFAVSLPTANEEGAMIFADRLHKKVSEAVILWQENRLPISISIGVVAPEHHPGQTPLSVVEETNLVLAKAIDGGGNQVVCESKLRKADVPLPSRPEPPPASPHPLPEISLDEAVALLAAGKKAELKPHLPSIKRRLGPLMRALGMVPANSNKK